MKQKLITVKINAYTLLQKEIAILKKIDHPHIVKLVEVIDDPECDKLYLVMEYMKKGSILSDNYKNLESKVIMS